MFLFEFNDFFAEKFEQKRKSHKWRPINIFANSFKNRDKRMHIEITEDQHSLIKQTCRKKDIDMKDFLWLVIELGYDEAVNHIDKLKEELLEQLPIRKKRDKRKFWHIFHI